MKIYPAVANVGTRLASLLKKYQDVCALLVIVWAAAPNLAAIRHYWHPNILDSAIWLNEAHLFFFDAALMILIAAIVTRRLTLPVFATAFALAAIPQAQWVIDIWLHEYLRDAGVYRLAFGPTSSEQVPNARASKVILFAVLGPVLIAQVMFARTRSLDRVFALMCTAAVALTTVLFHKALPGGVMTFAQRDVMYVSRFVAVAEPEHAAAFCAFLQSHCLTVRDRSELEHHLRTAGLDRLAEQARVAPEGTVIATLAAAVVDREHHRLKPVIVSTRIPKQGTTSVLMIEEGQPKKTDRVHARAFALLGIAAHSFWTLFATALCALHRWRGRGRLFRPTQAT